MPAESLCSFEVLLTVEEVARNPNPDEELRQVHGEYGQASPAQRMISSLFRFDFRSRLSRPDRSYQHRFHNRSWQSL